MKSLVYGSAAIVAATLVIGSGLVGCGQADHGTFPVSGRVTFEGQPVPAGYVRFVPNADEGNAGPATRATIRDGSYETPPGKGILGGAYTITVLGFDGVPYMDETENLLVETGRRLFPPHEQQATLSAEATRYDVDVP